MVIYCPDCKKEVLIEGFYNTVERDIFTLKEQYIHYDLYKCLHCNILWAKKESFIEFKKL